MKKNFILLPLIGAFIYVILSSSASGPAQFSGTNGTGSSGVNGCSCHNPSSTSSTTVTLELLSGSTPVSTYVGGNTYTIRITGTQTSSSFSLPKYGFQISTVKNSGAGTSGAVQAGSFSSPPSGTHIYTFGSLSIFEHTTATSPSSGSGGAGTTYVSSITWTAPATGTGTVKIYGVINAVNNNGTDDAGDKWNNGNITIPEAVGTIGGGTTSLCVGATTTYTCTPTGGTWSSASSGVATVGSTGIVTGVSAGTALISYDAGASGIATRTVSVVAAPAPITGTATVCVGSTTTLADGDPGGTWSSVSTAFATVGSSSGIVSGVASGTSVISYTLSSTGCAATKTVTVNSLPTAISGTLLLCGGATTALSSTPSGGTWTSGTTGVATVGSSSGVVTGVSGGTSVIDYTLSTGCLRSATVTVNTSPAPISGIPNVCQGSTITLTDPTAGGTWTSSSTGVASIVSAGTTATVTGVSAGTSVVSYTISSGCAAVVTVNVLPVPVPPSGLSDVCLGSTITLTDGSGSGSWSSGAPSIATVGVSSGIVTGMALGTAPITFTLSSTGCSSSTTVNVQPLPFAISGSSTVCIGTTTTLTDATIGGTWSSSAPGTAFIDAFGVVTGVSAGTATITYSSSAGCFVTMPVTVNAVPVVSAITGTARACIGTTTILSDGTGGGTWSSSAPSIATIGSTTGLVTGIAAGTSTITYSVTSSGCTGFATVVATVNPMPSAISGSTALCTGTTTTLSDASGAGTWVSGNTAVATVGSTTGVVTGASAGVAPITFTLTSTGCTISTIVTVNTTPPPITGPSTVCVGSTITVADALTGGTFSITPTSIATITSGGLVTGVSAGVAFITYSSGAGCSVTRTITVNALPAGIGGTSQVCIGSSTTLTDASGAGSWTSSDPSLATVGSTTGVVTGISAGALTITFTLTSTGCTATKAMTVNALPTISAGAGVAICSGSSTSLLASGGVTYSWSPATGLSCTTCANPTASPTTNTTYTVLGANSAGCTGSATVTVSVNALPAAIGGTLSVCEGLTRTLTDATSGGTWSSSDVFTATVGSSSGIVTGVAAGTVTITYTLGTGCFRTATFTVNTTPAAISGTAVVCVGQTTTLSDATGGGSWSSSNPAQATVGATTGVVTGIVSGTPVITYTVPGGCFATVVLTVNPLSAISGLSSLCAGNTTTLTDATGGGTWSSSNTAVATIGSSTGFVNALTNGTTDITYTLPTGCAATRTMTVISSPSPITGPNHVCIAGTTVLTDAGGGVWSSSNPSIANVGASTGIVTGVTVGVATITYSLGTGCTVTTPMSVNPLPSSIGGFSVVCEGSTITLTDPTSGGTWSTTSSNASVGATTGIVTGISAGTAVITYTSSAGCSVTRTITVNAVPATISGATSVCIGSVITLTDITGGGTWSVIPTTVASIGATSGNLLGVSSGVATVSYTLSSTGCRTTTTVTVNPLPSTISGTPIVCVGAVVTLTDATTGGTWSSSNPSIATVGATTGVVAGVSAGTTLISYTSASGCTRTITATVSALPVVASISGSTSLCTGTTSTLTDVTSGGVWTSSNPSVASIGSLTGVVAGVATGTATITYTVTNSAGCTSLVTTAVTVNASPAGITGTMSLCAGATTTLADATGGGTWSSTPTTIATIGSSTGVVSGVAAGTATITYALSSGCRATAVVTVNPLPSAITGTTHVCAGATVTLSSTPSGGTWSSSLTTIAVVGSSTGVVSGVLAGLDTITYTLPTGCLISAPITVNALPVAGSITGGSSVCAGDTIMLADATTGGAWSSANTTLATVGSTGIVTGVAAGVDTIKYTVTNICGSAIAMHAVTVNPLPDAGTITGASVVCVGSTGTLADAVTGGTWTSANTTIATVSTAGVVTGVAPGLDTISYSVTNVCGTATAIAIDTIVALPTAGTIVGTDSVCEGDTVHLGDLVTGGVWSTSLGNATVDASGVVTGVTAGTDTVHYTVTTICGVASVSLVMNVRSHADCNVGIHTVAAADGYKVYPNPSNGTFTVELPVRKEAATVTVSDILGKTIMVKRVAANERSVTISIGNAAAGSYLIKVSAGNDTYRQKIVIW